MFPKMRRSKQELPLAESLAILEKAPTGVLGVLDGDGYPYTCLLYTSRKKRRTKRNWSITSTAPFSKCLGSGYNVRAAV